MSLSIQQRKDNLELALKALASGIQDRTIGSFIIDPRDPFYKDVLPTTWLELKRYVFLKPFPRFSGRYLLTSLGLRRGLELLGMGQDKQMQADLGKLSKCLKDSVKGRHAAKGINVETVVSQTGLPRSFIMNVIDSELFEHWFKQYGVVWGPGFLGSLIIVPQDFGLPPLQ